MTCTFCFSKDIESRILLKNEAAIAFLSNQPIVPGHILIIPVRCVPTFEDLEDKELTAILQLRMKIKEVLISVLGAEGFHYAWNENQIGGQSVPHFHLHIVPRKKGDAGITDYEPRKFLYRPGSREVSPVEELKKTAEFLRSNLA